MDFDSTIVAVSSPHGNSPKAIIRVTGLYVFEHVKQLGLEVEPRMLKPQRLQLEDQVLPVLLGGFSQNASYTGQETVEVQLPNNQHLIDRVMNIFIHVTGGRFATAGEFTARAFFNGRLTLTQAEGVSATISADNDAELRGASLLREGVLASIVEPISIEITRYLALVEAGIDFTDEEDVVAIEIEELTHSIQGNIDDLLQILEGKISMEALRQLPRVVIAGAPNAGKSTLFNELLGKRRVVVSEIAGTTRDAIIEPAIFHGKEALLIDVAGFDEPGDKIESGAQTQAKQSASEADVVLFCVGPTQQIPEHDSRTIIVHTKGDIDSSHQDAISAEQLVGLEELKEQVAKKLLSMPSPHHDALALLPRHISHISETIVCLNQAKEDAKVPELVANSLRSALNEIGCITGAVTPDEVLGKVFASFCVGK